MQSIVRTFETTNHTYGFIKIINTTYEQQQQIKANRIYMIQKLLLITGLITVCTLLSILSLELLIPMVLIGSFGTIAILTNNI